MSDSFLARFLRIVQKVTQAERAFAVDSKLQIIDKINIDDETLQEPGFREFARTWLQRALDDGQTIITNNIITDPTKAPTTNTGFANLRVVICLPIRDHGAIYIDQHIRNGIIPRDLIDRLTDTVFYLQKNNQEDSTEDHILAVYEKMN